MCGKLLAGITGASRTTLRCRKSVDESVTKKGGSRMEELSRREYQILIDMVTEKRESIMKITMKDYDEYATIKVTRSHYCGSCAKDFEPMGIVYYALIDNNIIYKKCTKPHAEVEPKLFTQPYLFTLPN